jgi:hypothetical protein
VDFSQLFGQELVSELEKVMQHLLGKRDMPNGEKASVNNNNSNNHNNLNLSVKQYHHEQ